MDEAPIYSSVTRISDLECSPYSPTTVPRDEWATGDYVAATVTRPPSGWTRIELPNGRMREVYENDLVIGALGRRAATREATGTFEDVGEDLRLHALTSAGLLGRLRSKSAQIPDLIELEYRGHLRRGEERMEMESFAAHPSPTEQESNSGEVVESEMPLVLMVGTSMAAGKTTAARRIIRELGRAELRSVGAKLTGAGRYRDILSMEDAGAASVFDFVDAGLPGTVCSTERYDRALDRLQGYLAAADADVGVIEIGASPLEPYNGERAIAAIADRVRCTVLSTSDPYAVTGVMEAFDMEPDLVAGLATSTEAGIDLIDRLTGLPALNVLDPNDLPALRRLLARTLDLPDPAEW